MKRDERYVRVSLSEAGLYVNAAAEAVADEGDRMKDFRDALTEARRAISSAERHFTAALAMEHPRPEDPPELPTVKRCSSEKCRARIRWAETEKGKRISLDAEPDPEGDFILTWNRDRGEWIARKVWGDAAEGQPRYTTHFATCPDADRFRRRRAS